MRFSDSITLSLLSFIAIVSAAPMAYHNSLEARGPYPDQYAKLKTHPRELISRSTYADPGRFYGDNLTGRNHDYESLK